MRNHAASAWALLLLGALVGCGGSAGSPEPAKVEAAPSSPEPNTSPPAWIWKPEEASLEASIKSELSEYVVTKSAPPPNSWGDTTLVIETQSGVRTSFLAHSKTPLRRSGDRLFVANYLAMSSGCEIIAYDLARGAELWRKELQGLGPISHSKYHNSVTLQIEGEQLIVRSVEAAGRYVECLSLGSGAQLAHQLVPQ